MPLSIIFLEKSLGEEERVGRGVESEEMDSARGEGREGGEGC